MTMKTLYPAAFCAFLFGLTLLKPLSVKAQREFVEGYTIHYVHEHERVLDVFGLYGKDIYGIQGKFTKYFSLNKKRKFFLGTGLSVTATWSERPLYLTASPSLNRGSNSKLAFLRPMKEQYTDSIFADKSLIPFGCIFFTAQYRIHPKVEAGISIDLGGVTSSLFKDVIIQAGGTDSSSVNQRAMSSFLNLFMPGSLARGNLNYHIYGRFWFHHKWSVCAGVNYLYREYSLVNYQVNGGKRFRQTAITAQIGIGWAPFYHKKRPY